MTTSAHSSPTVRATLSQRLPDLGFVEGLRLPPGLDEVQIAADRLRLVVGADHPWARRRSAVGGAELARTPLVLREQGSGTREVLDRALAPFGGTTTPLLVLASTTALKGAAVSSAGPAVLSELAVADELARGRLVSVPLDGLDLSRPLRAVWPTGTRPAGPARDLLSLTRQPRSAGA